MNTPQDTPIQAREPVKKFDTGYWEIWIDDVDGELAMTQTHLAERKIEVVEAEVFNKLLSERDELRAQLEKANEVIELGRKVLVEAEISVGNGFPYHLGCNADAFLILASDLSTLPKAKGGGNGLD